MFEPISNSLSQLSYFTVLGFFFGAFYEIIRIIRLFKRQNSLAAGITDFLFLSFAGLITFAYALEFGNGSFRWFYILGVVFGGTVYFLTVGKLISFASELIVRCVKSIFSFIKRRIIIPLIKKVGIFNHFLWRKIVKFYGFIRENIINLIKHLKNKVKVLYNIRENKRKSRIKQKRIAQQEKQRIRSSQLVQSERNIQSKQIKITGEKRNVIKGKTKRTVRSKYIG
ncbi:MAG: spore cortex biosynthesis protein YabQ [Oscillospiraceae bacterium]|nr:spore cortex biosynthesis protein YabQ [Oscillospiraceae bacterium]